MIHVEPDFLARIKDVLCRLRKNLHALPGYRMRKAQIKGMERLPLHQTDFPAIELISDDGIAQMTQMNPDLMGPSG